MTRVARFTGERMPDGAMLLARGANRVCRQLNVDRHRLSIRTQAREPIEYELVVRFTVPEETVLDMKSIDIYET